MIDGFESNSEVIVIGATSKEGLMDKSILRSGRFDLKIRIGKPNLEEKMEKFRRCLVGLERDFRENSLEDLIRNTDLTCADIDCIVNELKYIRKLILDIAFIYLQV